MKIIKPPRLLTLLWFLEGLMDIATMGHVDWFHPARRLETKYFAKIAEERNRQKEEIDEK